MKKRVILHIRCSCSESHASRSRCRCYTSLAVATPFPATSQVGTRLPAATWHRCSIALKSVMHCSLVIARAFNWHISLLLRIRIVFYRSRNHTAFFQAPDASLCGCEMPDDYYSSQVSFYFLRQSRIQLSLTSYFLPTARFPMFSASSIILSFSFAVNER